MKFAGGGGVSWGKKDRGRAKKEKKFLFVIGFDGEAAGDGSIIYSGVCTKEEADQIARLMTNMLNKEKRGLGEEPRPMERPLPCGHSNRSLCGPECLLPLKQHADTCAMDGDAAVCPNGCGTGRP